MLLIKKISLNYTGQISFHACTKFSSFCNHCCTCALHSDHATTRVRMLIQCPAQYANTSRYWQRLFYSINSEPVACKARAKYHPSPMCCGSWSLAVGSASSFEEYRVPNCSVRQICQTVVYVKYVDPLYIQVLCVNLFCDEAF